MTLLRSRRVEKLPRHLGDQHIAVMPLPSAERLTTPRIGNGSCRQL
jgi:hypothetical protein